MLYSTPPRNVLDTKAQIDLLLTMVVNNTLQLTCSVTSVTASLDGTKLLSAPRASGRTVGHRFTRTGY